MLVRLRWSLALLCAAVCSLALVARQRDGELERERELELGRARERWSALSPQHRAELAERFERWTSLPDDERARIRERFDTLSSLRHAARECLPEKARKDLARLRSEQQASVLAGVASQQIQQRGRELLQRLPAHWRERIEAADPEERLRLVGEFRARMHAKALERIDQLERDGKLEASRAASLRQAAPEELARELVALEVRGFCERAEREGLPPYIDAAQWEQWKSLPQREQWERVHQARHGFERRNAGEGRGEGRRDGERGRLRWPASETERRLREALRPDPEWFVEFVNAEPEVRAELVATRLRARVLGVLEGSLGLLAAEKLAELRVLHGREFFEALQRALPELDTHWLRKSRPSEGDGRSGGKLRERSGEGARPRSGAR
ncbi:MAG: DUF3106 domain-containing protein [Planctomycetes bacterium]|nr:DUF3106 domain-containing protein [Planctomycetota bacterium]